MKKNAGWILKSFFFLAIGGTLLLGLLVGGVLWHYSRDLPKLITVADYRPHLVTQIIATGGQKPTVIGEFKKERRYLVPFDKIPEVVVHAFISAEDDKFFEHPGINIMSMIRAGIANFRAGHTVQGGSTITQQVAKSLLLTPEKSFSRKITEIILANQLERKLTKQQILYLYLNQIYLGHGAYGIEAATRTYFRKPATDITLPEAALLAGMPQAPGKYSPLLNPKRAKERQVYVLRRMMENGYITRQQMDAAIKQPLKIYHEEDINNKYAAYLVEQIRRDLVEKYGETAVYEDGLTVLTPTTPELSLAATKSVRDGLDEVDKRIGYRGPLKHLGSDAEIENYLKQLRVDVIEKKLDSQILLPDGQIDTLSAPKEFGFASETQLLDVGTKYEAVVTSVNDRSKETEVSLGSIRATIPFDKIKWAKPARDDKNPQAWHPEPKAPSQVVKPGDVVLVKVVSVDGDRVVVALDQEPQVQGALLSIDAKTGYVLAMVGGYDYEKSEFNRAIQAQRQLGSSFKPILYSAALEKGYTPASIIVDSPIVYEDSDSGKWKPANFEEKFYGDTTFRQALIKSRNVPTIKIAQAIQIPYVIDYARRLGMTAQLNPDLSLSLGSASVSLMEITKVYSLFPRLGRKVTPIYVSKVIDRDGKVLEEAEPAKIPPVDQVIPPMPSPSPSAMPVVAQQESGPGRPPLLPTYPAANDPDQVLDPRVAYVMTHLMTEVVAYGTGHEASNLDRPAAGKTGTTSDYIDAWFMGFTPNVVTGVWVGFDNHRSIGPLETGARAALPIWLGYMKQAVQGYPNDDFTVPPGVVFESIDQNTGKPAPPNSSRAIREAFIEGTEPMDSNDNNPTAAPAAPGDFFKEDRE